jgi:hypothetical protein
VPYGRHVTKREPPSAGPPVDPGAGICKRPGCGRPVVQSTRGGRRRLYCGQACRQRAYETRREDEHVTQAVTAAAASWLQPPDPPGPSEAAAQSSRDESAGPASDSPGVPRSREAGEQLSFGEAAELA